MAIIEHDTAECQIKYCPVCYEWRQQNAIKVLISSMADTLADLGKRLMTVEIDNLGIAEHDIRTKNGFVSVVRYNQCRMRNWKDGYSFEGH